VSLRVLFRVFYGFCPARPERWYEASAAYAYSASAALVGSPHLYTGIVKRKINIRRYERKKEKEKNRKI